jgi:hypothetical protein
VLDKDGEVECVEESDSSSNSAIDKLPEVIHGDSPMRGGDNKLPKLN